MADTPAAEAKPTEAPFSDDAWSSADGTRAAAKWIASALGAVPSLAVVAAVVRAPGDPGFDTLLLAAGVALAALGAVIGILAFAWVLTPVKLADAGLTGFDMTRVMGNPHATFDDLKTTVETIRSGIASGESELADAESQAGLAKASVAAADAELKRLKADLAAAGTGEDEKKRLAGLVPPAEHALAAATVDAEAKSAVATNKARSLKGWSTQLDRQSALRRQVFQLRSSDEIASRFRWATVLTVPAVGLVAAGIILLGLAPNPKADAADPPSLVTLELNEAGKKALNCNEPLIYGLRIGGSDEAPMVITFPTAACSAKNVKFKVDDPTSFGVVKKIMAVPSS